MKLSQFATWLADKYRTIDGGRLAPKVQVRYIALCRRVERFEGDLDIHFANDRLEGLLERLQYQRADHLAGIPPRHNIAIEGNAYKLTCDFRCVIRVYREFLSGASPRPEGSSTAKVIRRAREGGSLGWPMWSLPTDDEVLQLAIVITPYVRFLNPEIVRAIVDDNSRNQERWRAELQQRGIDPDFYLWEKSACAFPGIRRYSGGPEISAFRARDRSMPPPEALKLDDNHFPKHLWSLMLVGRKFQNQGPPGYALAHLMDHKRYGSRLASESDLSEAGLEGRPIHGLFTSAANTVYAPSTYIRPTDFEGRLRRLLQRRASELYGDFCNLLPPRCCLVEHENDWDIRSFKWAEPVGTTDYIDSFLSFRRQTFDGLLSTTRDATDHNGRAVLQG